MQSAPRPIVYFVPGKMKTEMEVDDDDDDDDDNMEEVVISIPFRIAVYLFSDP